MDMDSRQLIDAQFDRAVEIVQSLPKTGPIQTAYEDKLNMYRYVSTTLRVYREIHRVPQLVQARYFPRIQPPALRRFLRRRFFCHLSATVGNVQGPRPSVWDMLGRAKW